MNNTLIDCPVPKQVVIGIVAWFIAHYNHNNIVLIYVEIFACLNFLYAIVLVVAFNSTRRWMMWLDLVWAAIWLAAWGAMVSFDNDDNFDDWEPPVGGNFYACWGAAEAFCFICFACWIVLAGFALFTPGWQRRIPSGTVREQQRPDMETQRPGAR